MWQEGTEITDRPYKTETWAFMFFANNKKSNHCNNSKYCIGQSCGKFINSKKLHATGLQPKKQRWLFPKWLKINLYPMVISSNDHLAGRFCKIDFVPIKKMHSSQEGYKKNDTRQNDYSEVCFAL